MPLPTLELDGREQGWTELGCPTKSVKNQTPQEAWSGYKPSVSHLKIFGCIAYAQVPEAKRKKLDDRDEKCIFIGYSEKSKAYKLYNPLTNKVVVSRDVIFSEEETWNWDKEEKIKENQIEIEEQEADHGEQNQENMRQTISTPAPHASSSIVRRSPDARLITPEACLYVDDLLFTGNSQEMFDKFKHAMFKEFEMTDYGLMSYFLGIEVRQQADCILISQKRNAMELLKKFRLDGCNTVSTPVAMGSKLTKEGEGKTVDSTLFKSLIGSLRYFTITRPDIVYGVGLLSRYMEIPKESHWLAAKTILRYISGTLKFGLFYSYNEDAELYGYSDSDWGGDQDERKSTTGMLGTKTSTWDTTREANAYGWTETSSSIFSDEQVCKLTIVDGEEEKLVFQKYAEMVFDKYVNNTIKVAPLKEDRFLRNRGGLYQNGYPVQGSIGNGRNRPTFNSLQQPNIPAMRYPISGVPPPHQPFKKAGNSPTIDSKEAARRGSNTQNGRAWNMSWKISPGNGVEAVPSNGVKAYSNERSFTVSKELVQFQEYEQWKESRNTIDMPFVPNNRASDKGLPAQLSKPRMKVNTEKPK
ncbi:hypothetical protein HHK36_005225 [Tetracentron sinense]|uniref:Reverse transcriptase Ty1/copia-type domain-containing protein n=1 Tax=Tetracentron sinense TaxID=13715 RepID=A0A834ZMS7_TETSI|nr:hypothetical protein HHK36_005225 [Tetracentron sinense]